MDIAYKFNFPPPRSNRIFHEYLFTYVYTIHTYFRNFFRRRKKQRERKKRRRRRSIRRVEIPYTKDILRGRKNDEQRDRAFSMARSPDQRLSNDRPTRYHPAAHYDRRDRGVPRLRRGPFFVRLTIVSRKGGRRKRCARATRKARKGPVACWRRGAVVKNVENNWAERPRCCPRLFVTNLDRAAIKASRDEEKAASRVLPPPDQRRDQERNS